MFRVLIHKNAKKDLKKIISSSEFSKIKKALRELEENPLMGDVKPLKYIEFAQFRKRAGNYRILFNIDYYQNVISILRIRHRKEVYR